MLAVGTKFTQHWLNALCLLGWTESLEIGRNNGNNLDRKVLDNINLFIQTKKYLAIRQRLESYDLSLSDGMAPSGKYVQHAGRDARRVTPAIRTLLITTCRVDHLDL